MNQTIYKFLMISNYSRFLFLLISYFISINKNSNTRKANIGKRISINIIVSISDFKQSVALQQPKQVELCIELDTFTVFIPIEKGNKIAITNKPKTHNKRFLYLSFMNFYFYFLF